MKKPFLTIIATMFCTLGVCQDFEFKGIRVGADAAEVTADKSWRCTKDKRDAVDTDCFKQAVTIAGVTSNFAVVSAFEGKIMSVSVRFKTSDFAQIRDALIEKYGPGKLETDEVTTPAGGKYSNRTVNWNRPTERMSVIERFTKIDAGAFFINLIEDPSIIQKRQKDNAKANSSDL